MTLPRFTMSETVPRQATPETFTIIEKLFERLYRRVDQLSRETNDVLAGGVVVGPTGGVDDGSIVLFDGTSGALLKQAAGTGVVHATGGIYSVGAVDLASEVSGDLAVSHLAGGAGASAATFWRGDGTWASSGSLHNLLSDTHPDTVPGETPDIGALVQGKAFLAGLAEGFWADGLPFASGAGPNSNVGVSFWSDGLPAGEMGTISDVRWGKLDPPTVFGSTFRGGPTGLFWDDGQTLIDFLDRLSQGIVVPLAGTKTYYVSDSSGGAVNRKLTLKYGVLTAET